MKTKTKLWFVTIFGLVAVVGVLVAVKAGQIGSMIKAGKSFVPPPESVTTATVETASWEQSKAAIGTLVAVRAVTLGAEVTGTVREVSFDSGGSVKSGTVLVRLDTSTEHALLASSQADAALAKLSLERAQSLRHAGANAQADLDLAVARAKQAEAAVANLTAIIAKKTLRAPFDGRISIRQVELGQVVSPGTPIASLQSVSPIHADFYFPQQALAELQAGQRARLRTDIFPDARWDGVVSTINPEVDVATRNVRVRATFENPDGRLRPGMFANVEVLSNEERSAVVIPATAVLYAPYGDSVYIVEEKKDTSGRPSSVAHQKFVRLGERRGDFVAIAGGLEPGETVISSGAFKLRNGVAVKVNNALAFRPELAPRPVNP
jgi:membrane fusion protein (multidrug efflux system)